MQSQETQSSQTHTKPPQVTLDTKALPPLPTAEPSPNDKRLSQPIPIIVQPSPTLSTPIRQESEQNYLRLQELYEQEKQKSQSLEDIKSQYSQLQRDHTELENLVKQLWTENETFRRDIFELKNGCEPIRGEDHYVRMFEELRGLTETEVVKLSKMYGRTTLSKEDKEHVLRCLPRLGEHGKRTAEYLMGEYTLDKLYSEGRWRHQFIRHIVGLYILDFVFRPFAFGLSKEVSEGMKFIQNDILIHEKCFSNVLMIHQSKGCAAMRLANSHVKQRKEEVAAGITGILLMFLVKGTEEESVRSVVQRIVEKAVQVKNAITVEQALYECFWVDCGEEFKEEVVDVVEEEPTGKILLCTFPGLGRTVKEGDNISSVTVVKASATLESSFVTKD